MKKTILSLFLVLALAVSCSDDDKNNNTSGPDFSNLKIYTETYMPYNFVEDGQVKGISGEFVSMVMDELSIDQDITSENWDIIYNRLLTEDNIVLFTTMMTPERKGQMKWAGPICSTTDYFYVKSSSETTIHSLAEAKALGSIGAVKDYSITQLLQNSGFTNLVLADNLGEIIEMLMNGEVDAIVEAPYALAAALEAAGSYTKNEVRKEFLFEEVYGYVAFSLNISDDIVDAWQQKVDFLKQQGTLQQLYDKYIDGETALGNFQILTEENPPQNFAMDNGTIDGSSAEIMKEILSRSGMDIEIKLTDWTSAYNKCLYTPNLALFSTGRTVAREDLFQWVGPLCRKKYKFYTLTSSGLVLNSLDEAKTVAKVATMAGWLTVTQLEEEGFTNVFTYETVYDVFTALMNGEVGAIVINDIALPSVCEKMQRPISDLTPGPDLSESVTYIAISNDSDPIYYQKWTEAYEAMKNDGSLKEIINKWYPGLDMQL